MIAAAVAGADVVDVAIDSKQGFWRELKLLNHDRHVRCDLTTVDGRRLHGT